MHVPDGFLTPGVALGAAALSAAGLGLALRDARLRLPRRRVPLLGLSAAAVLVAQMVNFPVAGGTSGHLVGGVLAAALVGPTAAVIVLSAVLVVQCLVFADGGLLALGANVLNMALVGTLGGYAVARAASRLVRGRRGWLIAQAAGAWLSTVLAALCCAGELAASGTAPARPLFLGMVGVHAVIGVGEAILTALVLGAVSRARPELFSAGEQAKPGALRSVALGLIVTLALALALVPLASTAPDGLEAVASSLGFARRARAAAGPALLDLLGQPLRAVLGALVVGFLTFGLLRLLTRRRVVRPAEPGWQP